MRFIDHDDSFNTQPPKGGWATSCSIALEVASVSTHSRLKAAGAREALVDALTTGFNTQPPKGGWASILVL